ncbi:UDP-N-acetylglucosamine 1-carboxyvinyltransferase [Limnochorda pilosa]|uniref:UDP-N-acetylglucosamine 1-carboxyvinyltransferase n=1 Tax=Limnochorda pilosa TaxID=1555112 RepID=A0A0K2SJ71_LIMPI|nr:UDP-N-acetylglucosamine 1-carboxyvinyltransferase [Limnochorda pilosa]BAS27082.1 UDP-N-acetylglucosamine 1-carboxyvinyltransferase [Limnochorda pilosa]
MQLVVEGGHPLSGEVLISGAKNAALAILPALAMTQGNSLLTNIPDIADVRVMLRILEEIGCAVEHDGERVRLEVPAHLNPEVPYSEGKQLRASSLLLGPLVARLGEARVPLPGGCKIGSRPIDLHLKALEALGAQCVVEHGFVVARAPLGLHGGPIYLDFPSVGATENAIMAAALAQGTTVIHNAAREPEIVDLATALNRFGARVVGAGTDVIRVKGVDGLSGGEHSIIPDRIETGTYLLAGLMGGGPVVVSHVIPTHIEPLLAKLEEAGVRLMVGGDQVRAWLDERPRAVQVKTLPYPGFPTDLQPQITSFLLQAEGTSIVTERIFEDRFGHVDELKRLGARIKTEGRTAVIEGVERLSGAPITATDLRQGASLVLAGLAAEGETVIDGLEHLDRGYEHLEEKLAALGARVHRVEGIQEPVWV